MSGLYGNPPPTPQQQQQQRRLELSLNPENGSLSTAPLSQVLLACTDALYQDLYNMAHGELDVVVPSSLQETAAEDTQASAAAAAAAVDTALVRKERMSNLSFAQRRHELAWRLSMHGKAIQHVAALTAAAADISQMVAISSKALQHARTAWVRADEAQDALYFFHAQLFPARASPHDVYGALDVILGSPPTWHDLPTDLQLSVDRYESMARVSICNKQEIDQRWQMAVRNKLLTGGERLQGSEWNAKVKGGIVKLTVGKAKNTFYPIEALLTVFAPSNRWTLLSLQVNVQAKTGEFHHQLEVSNRQRYDLHRLAALAMNREEAAFEQGVSETSRPLLRLFQVAQRFSLSWQLEMLSAQAQALRRGVWAAISAESTAIHVTPVRFFDNDEKVLGVVSMSFWKVDEAYGPPSMGDLSLEDKEQNGGAEHSEKNGHNYKSYASSSNQLVLSVRAETTRGIRVSLSGASSIVSAMSTHYYVQQSVQDLIEAASNPLSLSASDCLLAATILCADRKCHAVVHALHPPSAQSRLASWMHLSVIDRATIAVSAELQYYGYSNSRSRRAILFRLSCDARTGSFVATFPRSMLLLRQLASNSGDGSEAMALRIASLPKDRQRAARSNFTGRYVRDAFQSLERSLNLLGQRTGVGGSWDNNDSQSGLLRERAIQSVCIDVKAALIKCCGMAALYGIAPLALSAAFGLMAQPDIADSVLEMVDGKSLLPAPPISVVLEQDVIETAEKNSDGITKKSAHIEQELFSLCCSSDDAGGLCLYPLNILTTFETPTTVSKRVKCSLLSFSKEEITPSNGNCNGVEPSHKKLKVTNGDPLDLDHMDEVSIFASVLSNTIETCLEA